MNLQYISDYNGNKTAVIIPIADWQSLTKKYKDLEEKNITEDIPQWHKDLLDERFRDNKEPEDAFQMLDNIETENEKI
jgi:hypothetical protein